ncbi:phage head spike fiber domain-containing protein [Massilia phyllosphaerae]|uniref:phage head spike fiber domain-containing protein n=1 Tax=Massilia phyllosphaerae TaxID=3106034 RepID=UPI002B1CC4AE|nr:hypothetical protein [Massilia sp. SGZ-792]
MANLRIIASNAARRATLTASSTAGLLGVANLVADKKSDVWRATGASARISGTLSAPEVASGAVLLGNFSPTATMRVRLSNEASKTNLLTYSEAFGDSSWEKVGLNLSGGVAAPDGSNNAFAVTATGSDPYFDKTLTLAPGTYTFSIFLKGIGGSVGKAPNVWFWNIGGLGGFVSAVDARPLANGWVRYAATCTVATGGSYRVRVDAPDSASAGDVVHIFGAQVESGALSSYFSSGASQGVRPAGYIDAWQSYDCDTGLVPACPAPAIQLEGWTAAQSASAYAYGGGAYARAWFPETQFRAFAIDLVDTNNLQGYIEASKLVIGRYWSPPYGLTSVSATDVDATTHYSTAAGDLPSRASTISKEISIEMSALAPADRARLASILRASRAYPIFVSVRTGDPDLDAERAHTVLGKRMGDSEVALQAAERYGSKVTVRSI